MIQAKLLLAVLLAAFSFAPASAAPSNKQSKAKSGKAAKIKAKAPEQGAQDRRFNVLSMQLMGALWRIDPEGAIAAGRFDGAGTLTIPNAATRAAQLAFAQTWLKKLARFDPARLSMDRRTDLALLINKLEAQRWRLSSQRQFEWNPALYNIAGPIELVLASDYASESQRLRTLLRRLAGVPEYYLAAQESLVNPSAEHTRLALTQAPGTLMVLAELGTAVQQSSLNQAEKQLFAQRIASAGNALIGYVDFLVELEQSGQATGSGQGSARVDVNGYWPKAGAV